LSAATCRVAALGPGSSPGPGTIEMESGRILVIGLGNPILGDDGVGWAVAQQVQEQLNGLSVAVECLAVGGLRLMEFMVGYTHAIVVDALTTRQQPPGVVTCFSLAEMPDLTAGHTTSAHDVSLQSAIEMGNKMGLSLPAQVMVIGVEAHDVYEFSETLSEPVRAAIPEAVERVLHLIDEYRRDPQDDLP
jgi:hydrogenase maturation protease